MPYGGFPWLRDNPIQKKLEPGSSTTVEEILRTPLFTADVLEGGDSMQEPLRDWTFRNMKELVTLATTDVIVVAEAASSADAATRAFDVPMNAAKLLARIVSRNPDRLQPLIKDAMMSVAAHKTLSNVAAQNMKYFFDESLVDNPGKLEDAAVEIVSDSMLSHVLLKHALENPDMASVFLCLTGAHTDRDRTWIKLEQVRARNVVSHMIRHKLPSTFAAHCSVALAKPNALAYFDLCGQLLEQASTASVGEFVDEMLSYESLEPMLKTIMSAAMEQWRRCMRDISLQPSPLPEVSSGPDAVGSPSSSDAPASPTAHSVSHPLAPLGLDLVTAMLHFARCSLPVSTDVGGNTECSPTIAGGYGTTPDSASATSVTESPVVTFAAMLAQTNERRQKYYAAGSINTGVLSVVAQHVVPALYALLKLHPAEREETVNRQVGRHAGSTSPLPLSATSRRVQELQTAAIRSGAMSLSQLRRSALRITAALSQFDHVEVDELLVRGGTSPHLDCLEDAGGGGGSSSTSSSSSIIDVVLDLAEAYPNDHMCVRCVQAMLNDAVLRSLHAPWLLQRLVQRHSLLGRLCRYTEGAAYEGTDLRAKAYDVLAHLDRREVVIGSAADLGGSSKLLQEGWAAIATGPDVPAGDIVVDSVLRWVPDDSSAARYFRPPPTASPETASPEEDAPPAWRAVLAAFDTVITGENYSQPVTLEAPIVHRPQVDPVRPAKQGKGGWGQNDDEDDDDDGGKPGSPQMLTSPVAGQTGAAGAHGGGAVAGGRQGRYKEASFEQEDDAEEELGLLDAPRFPVRKAFSKKAAARRKANGADDDEDDAADDGDALLSNGRGYDEDDPWATAPEIAPDDAGSVAGRPRSGGQASSGLAVCDQDDVVVDHDDTDGSREASAGGNGVRSALRPQPGGGLGDGCSLDDFTAVAAVTIAVTDAASASKEAPVDGAGKEVGGSRYSLPVVDDDDW